MRLELRLTPAAAEVDPNLLGDVGPVMAGALPVPAADLSLAERLPERGLRAHAFPCLRCRGRVDQPVGGAQVRARCTNLAIAAVVARSGFHCSV